MSATPTKKNYKNLLIILLLAVIIAGIAGYRMWNKPHPKAEDATAIKVETEALYQAFATNEQNANTTYLNKVVEVSGVITELSNNQDGKQVMTLATSDPMGGVQCTLRDDAAIKTGDMVTVKGFCTGYTLSVLLNDCVLIPNK